MLLATLGLYRWLGGGWGIFFALFLVPDLSMVGYLRDIRLGATIYNLGHTYAAPALLAGAMWLVQGGQPSPLILIWVAHIAFDRVLGYGLKRSEGFRYTHLMSWNDHSVASNNPI